MIRARTVRVAEFGFEGEDETALEPKAATSDRFGQIGEQTVETSEESPAACVGCREIVRTGKLSGKSGGSDAPIYVEQGVSLVSQIV